MAALYFCHIKTVNMNSSKSQLPFSWERYHKCRQREQFIIIVWKAANFLLHIVRTTVYEYFYGRIYTMHIGCLPKGYNEQLWSQTFECRSSTRSVCIFLLESSRLIPKHCKVTQPQKPELCFCVSMKCLTREVSLMRCGSLFPYHLQEWDRKPFPESCLALLHPASHSKKTQQHEFQCHFRPFCSARNGC